MLALLALAPQRVSASAIQIIAWEAGEHSALLYRPAQGFAQAPTVLILPDALQRDLRHERYAEHLLASGIAVLVPQNETFELGWMIQRLRVTPQLDVGRLGLLAFGAGAAQAVVEAGYPTVLLYPGCATVTPVQPAPPLLLLHGDLDPANPRAACEALAARWAERGSPVEYEVLPGAGYAWDFEPVGGFRRALLPAPGLPHRVVAEHDGAAVDDAADRLTQFFRQHLTGEGP